MKKIFAITICLYLFSFIKC